MRPLALLLAGLLLAACSDAPSPSDPVPVAEARTLAVDLDSFFVAIDGPATFVLEDGQTGTRRVFNAERAEARFTPASTFKIPNSLIALETGVADGPDFAIPWDSTVSPRGSFWPDAWARDQTLQSAFRNSVYWYYQEIARRIGRERMQTYLTRFNYGNRSTGPAVDLFWLEGDLLISPEEQVRFLRRFYEGSLGVSARATDVVKDLMVLADTSGYRLSGKTGTAMVTPTRELGWLVGYVERGGAVHYYALNMEGERVWEEWPPQARTELVARILRALDVI